jgi:glycine betaine/proline transport system substrate-binding protein
MGWDENVAISTLTKVVLEEELGYEEVELSLESENVGALFREVSDDELDAFQDVWMPNLAEHLGEVEDEVEHLDPWFRGTTKFGLAVPVYMRTEDGEAITSIDQLTQTEAEEIIGIEPSTVIMDRIPENVIPEYGLEQRLIEAPTPGMLAEVEKRYTIREPFVFVAWSPHWMNQEYDFNYLEDPKGALGSLTKSSELSTIVRDDLREDDPVAYAFLDELTLTERQVNELEGEIVTAGDPVEGVKAWLEGNRDVVQPWVGAAKRARELA